MPVAAELFVPGRLCLLGEHSDWAGGWRRADPALHPGCALLVGTDQGLRARVRPLPGALRLRAAFPDQTRSPTFELPLEPEALRHAARAGGFESYVAGTACQLLLRFPGLCGVDLDNHLTDLPVGKGLSSSAAACVLTVRAFCRVNGLSLSRREEMELAFLGETTTPSRCGRLDQGCAYGQQPVLMRFDGDVLSVEPLAVGAALHLAFVDLAARKDTHRILADLNACFPAVEGAVAAGVRRALGPENQRLVEAGARAVEAGDAEALGALMTEAQALFDRLVAPACPAELTAPALHRLLAEPTLRPFVLGGKGVGSQGDGCAQFVCRDAGARCALIDRLRAGFGLTALPLTIPAR